ncbi:MAG: sacsin N-terminal ATP-binding-like domain-containing protein, partial [Bacteroidales bacterium]
MQIKCAQKFRQWYKQLKPANNNDYYNENFIGSTHGETLGFFSLFHGDKDDIYSFLRKETEMAEDAQAIYEFVQNAADSNSTHFYMFYDDNYFMAINNGEMFTKEGVKSILNIGQSHGKVDNPDKIGRFGIGFKLVHRLVGKTSGLKELIDEYRGPQMYSWGRLSDFTNFANSSEFSGSEIESESPWLFKILITNFPASVDEVVKDINYKDRTVFPKSEVEEFQSFLRNNLPRIDQSVMKQGTIFFIKLGEGKNKQIKKDQDLINNRLQNCLYLLKDLEHIQINNEVVQRNPDFILEKSFVINPDEDDFKRIGLQEQRDLKYPFNLQFGYLPYTEESRDVIDYPNFYKFFPMEDTIYKLKFILHSNVFSIGSNRRHLHDDSINKELLELFSSKITERLDIYQTTDKNKYNTIFCNIITSECDNKFINEHFQDHLFNYCSENIPVSDCDDYMDASDVVIKKTDLNLHPSDFGLDKNWLLWSDGNSSQYKNLINKCKKDLGLKSYSLKDLLEEGNIEDINYWINSYGEDQYNIFLIELEKSIPKNIADIEFIRFDDCFYSLSELINKEDYIINFQLIEPIKEILENLNFNISLDSFDSYPNLRNAIGTYAPYIKDGEEKNLFDLKLKENLKENFLSPQEKEILFKTLMQFKNLGSITLSKELYLFKDVQGDIRPLCEMINPELIKEAWFENYSIDQDELFPELQKSEFLINERTLFNRIIQPDWTNITEDIDKYSINDFYICVQKYYNETENPLSLEGLDFVFTNCESFTDSNSIFYHKDLINFSEYSALSEIIEAGDYAIVPQNLLHFFNEKPFKIENSDLTDLFITSEYTQEAIDALLRFLSG